MQPTKNPEKKTPKSPIKIVVYFKKDEHGREFTPEEILKKYNRKEQYIYCYFPKAGGGWITNHEKGFDNADKQIRDIINNNNTYKSMIFLCKNDGSEERVVNYVDKVGWEFYSRPTFVTLESGHRYISKYQTLEINKKQIAA